MEEEIYLSAPVAELEIHIKNSIRSGRPVEKK